MLFLFILCLLFGLSMEHPIQTRPFSPVYAEVEIFCCVGWCVHFLECIIGCGSVSQNRPSEDVARWEAAALPLPHRFVNKETNSRGSGSEKAKDGWMVGRKGTYRSVVVGVARMEVMSARVGPYGNRMGSCCCSFFFSNSGGGGGRQHCKRKSSARTKHLCSLTLAGAGAGAVCEQASEQANGRVGQRIV